jgi:hypothetical protein
MARWVAGSVQSVVGFGYGLVFASPPLARLAIRDRRFPLSFAPGYRLFPPSGSIFGRSHWSGRG